jgi:very-short-patch-repair endonuclease
VLGERNIEAVIGHQTCTSLDEAIAVLAERQHGVVGRWQLLAIGLGARAIRHRVETGRLHPAHRGVYAVGHRRLSKEGRWMAAVLAAGRDAVLSHASAAGLWAIRYPANQHTEVTAPRRIRPPRGIRAYRRPLPPDEVTVERGIPVTTVPRTLLDLAAVLPPRQVERAIEEAEVRRLDDPLSLTDLVERYPGRRGTGVVKSILALNRIGSTITRSGLEEAFLSFIEAHSLPSPDLNAAIKVSGRWFEADCAWRRHRMIVELDARSTHGTAAAFERDRARDRALHAAGWRVVRVTVRQLRADADGLARDLRSMLTLAPPR